MKNPLVKNEIPLELPGPTLARPACIGQASGRKTRSRLYAPMPVLAGYDVDRLEAPDQRFIRPPTAERHLQVHLVRSDMDRRALVPLAPCPAVARPGQEILELVVAVFRPKDDFATGDPHMRKIARCVDGGFIATI